MADPVDAAEAGGPAAVRGEAGAGHDRGGAGAPSRSAGPGDRAAAGERGDRAGDGERRGARAEGEGGRGEARASSSDPGADSGTDSGTDSGADSRAGSGTDPGADSGAGGDGGGDGGGGGGAGEGGAGRDRGPDPGSEREQDEQGYGEFGRVYHQIVTNNFHGSVDAAGSVFGAGAAAHPGLAPGSVDQAEVSAALEFHLPPDPQFGDAHGKLTRGHIVALIGEDGTGRRAGAFALLRRMLGAAAPLRSLSPADSLADLAASGAIRRGHGYVVLDYVGEVHAPAVQEFDMRRLAEQLRERDAYLVITASQNALRRQALKNFCTVWAAPDSGELFDHCLAALPEPPAGSAPAEDVPPPTAPHADAPPADVPADAPPRDAAHDAAQDDARDDARDVASDAAPGADRLPELRALVTALRRPSDVVAVVRTLARSGVEQALDALRDGERAAVVEWFAGRPPAEEALPVAALAFAEGLPERTFEEVLFALVVLARSWEHTAAGATVEAAVPAVADVRLGQSRARWRESANGLVEARRIPGPDGGPAGVERRVVFTSPRIRGLVVEQLNERYGLELWYPLRQWLTRLSQEPDLQVRAQVAAGLALLARYAPAEVEQNHLDAWSAGYTAQRVTAALTVQFMGADPALAPQALDLALRWADRAGQERAVTAAMALAGGLGRLYRFEALNWLWFLAMRGERVAIAARRSLHLMLATAEDDPERATLVLRYVRTRLEKTRGARERSAALAVAVHLLTGQGLDDTGPLPAGLLRTGPASAGALGRLWARALHSGRRRMSLSALCATLAALRDEPQAAGAVRTLGEAMREAMTARQWESLRHDLSAALRHPDYAVDDTRRLARVLLGSLRAGQP